MDIFKKQFDSTIPGGYEYVEKAFDFWIDSILAYDNSEENNFRVENTVTSYFNYFLKNINTEK
ncbi:hypothetical protein D3C76_1665570 [compost metagenome]